VRRRPFSLLGQKPRIRPGCRRFPSTKRQRYRFTPRSLLSAPRSSEGGLPPARRVAKHRPATHQQPPGDGYNCNFLPSRTTAADSLVNGPRPIVVLQAHPADLDQHGPEQSVALPTDVSFPVGVTRLILSRGKADVAPHMLAVLKPVRVSQNGDHNLSEPRPNSRNGSQQPAFRLFLFEDIELGFDTSDQLVHALKRIEFAVQLAAPEVVVIDLIDVASILPQRCGAVLCPTDLSLG
jgi:hypothetical protein